MRSEAELVQDAYVAAQPPCSQELICAPRAEILFELEVVEASRRGIIGVILTKLFRVALQPALSGSAEFNIYHDDSTKSKSSGGIPPPRNRAREQFRQPCGKVFKTEIIDGGPVLF